MITVIDYGAGNLRSVENALKHLGASYQITSQPADVTRASAILLPGVGHFGQMMRSLQVLNMTPVLRQAIEDGVPYLGICLGMQALYERSEEAPTWEGLGVFQGTIRRFPQGLKVPHMGWNQARIMGGSRLFEGMGPEPFLYFAHSYFLPVEESTPASERVPRIAALTDYGQPFVAAVEKDNICGVQFHPEKSGEAGLRCLANFVRANADAPRSRHTRGSEHAG